MAALVEDRLDALVESADEGNTRKRVSTLILWERVIEKGRRRRAHASPFPPPWVDETGAPPTFWPVDWPPVGRAEFCEASRAREKGEKSAR